MNMFHAAMLYATPRLLRHDVCRCFRRHGRLMRHCAGAVAIDMLLDFRRGNMLPLPPLYAGAATMSCFAIRCLRC